MNHQIISILDCNGNKVFGNSWTIDKPKANVVIIHGMCEYSMRYNDFAIFLNSQGYNVYAIDHLGHGELNCPNEKGLGVWPKDGFEQCVDNAYQEILEAKKNGLETYVFAHSMGSFMGQRLIQKYPGCVKRIILSGSSGPQSLYPMGAILAKMHGLFKNKNKKSKFLTKLSFGNYNKLIEEKYSKDVWLSWNQDNVKKYDKDKYCNYLQSRMFYISFTDALAKLFKKKRLEQINKDTEILLLVGENDPVGNYAKSLYTLKEMYLKQDLKCDLIVYPHMRHEILNEDKKAEVMKDIISFLKK